MMGNSSLSLSFFSELVILQALLKGRKEQKGSVADESGFSSQQAVRINLGALNDLNCDSS